MLFLVVTYLLLFHCRKKNILTLTFVSEVVSYLGLLQISGVVRDTINIKVADWRERPTSSGSTRVLQEHESQILHDEAELITMSQVKLMSSNISRYVISELPQ